MLGPHTHRHNPLSRIVCAPIAPHVTVCYYYEMTTFLFFLDVHYEMTTFLFFLDVLEKLPSLVQNEEEE